MRLRYLERNLQPYWLYLGQNDWLDMKREVDGWKLAPIPNDPTLRPEYMGMKVVVVNEGNWIAIGTVL